MVSGPCRWVACLGVPVLGEGATAQPAQREGVRLSGQPDRSCSTLVVASSPLVSAQRMALTSHTTQTMHAKMMRTVVRSMMPPPPDNDKSRTPGEGHSSSDYNCITHARADVCIDVRVSRFHFGSAGEGFI